MDSNKIQDKASVKENTAASSALFKEVFDSQLKVAPQKLSSSATQFLPGLVLSNEAAIPSAKPLDPRLEIPQNRITNIVDKLNPQVDMIEKLLNGFKPKEAKGDVPGGVGLEEKVMEALDKMLQDLMGKNVGHSIMEILNHQRAHENDKYNNPTEGRPEYGGKLPLEGNTPSTGDDLGTVMKDAILFGAWVALKNSGGDAADIADKIDQIVEKTTGKSVTDRLIEKGKADIARAKENADKRLDDKVNKGLGKDQLEQGALPLDKEMMDLMKAAGLEYLLDIYKTFLAREGKEPAKDQTLGDPRKINPNPDQSVVTYEQLIAAITQLIVRLKGDGLEHGAKEPDPRAAALAFGKSIGNLINIGADGTGSTVVTAVGGRRPEPKKPIGGGNPLPFGN